MNHHWSVTIPYYHRFTVVAENESQALAEAHNQEGIIVGYDDDLALVELADDVFGIPDAETAHHNGSGAGDLPCICGGCNTCGTHCVPGCGSGKGRPCTV